MMGFTKCMIIRRLFYKKSHSISGPQIYPSMRLSETLVSDKVQSVTCYLKGE